MDKKFPIVPVVKGALAAPLSHPASLIRTVVIVLLSLVVPVFYAVSNGITLEILEAFGDPNKADIVEQHVATVGMLYLITVVILAPVAAYLFNYWVRFGANGAEGAGFPTTGQMISAALINMIKFFLIFLLIGLAVLVIYWLLSMLGLAPSLDEQAAMAGDYRQLTISTFFSSVIALIAMCIIYSLFSANLTQTALKTEKEGLEHPHTIDFAIVLFLVYMVSFLPGVLAGLLDMKWLGILLSATLGVYVTLAIAVAHGIRFSICIQDVDDTDDEDDTGE